MRRQSVPACGRVMTPKIAARLSELLSSPEVAPVFEKNLQPLAGIRWQGLGSRRMAVAGEVALFDVPEPGELQTW